MVIYGHLYNGGMAHFQTDPHAGNMIARASLRPDRCWDAEASISSHSFPSLLAERPNNGTIVFHGQSIPIMASASV